MLRVGLTGSIAVGKSFVSSELAALGCHVLDADAVARALVAPGTPGLAAVVEAFGENILSPDGALDRARLGELIFPNKEKREALNAILHPMVIKAQDAQLADWEKADPAGIAIVDAALMIESGGYTRFHKLIVVFCSPQIQLLRIMDRNHLSRNEAQMRIDAQIPQEEKKRYADYLVDTSNGYDPTREQVARVHHSLLSLDIR